MRAGALAAGVPAQYFAIFSFFEVLACFVALESEILNLDSNYSFSS
jgi:hypothetical protein